MIPGQHGRHCISCDKTVIDFSGMSDEEVQLFFIQHRQKPICGRFKTSQIERITIHLPGNIFSKRLSVWQKYLVALLICFGSNLFSLDVVIGNNSGLHAQAVQSNAKQSKTISQKTKKKKKYKLQKVKWITINEKFILGFTQTVPIDKKLLISTLLKPLPQSREHPSVDSISGSNEEKKPAKKEVPKKREQGMEFILPQAVLMRRRQPK